jgi:hypothetical protein
MRMRIAAMLAMLGSVALTSIASISTAVADETGDAHKLAIQGRDDYWHCLAREYSRDGNQSLNEQDFSRSVAGACPSERQNYRVTLLDYLSMQYPNIDSNAHLATANRAVESAQKDIVTAFVKRRAPQR